MNNKKELKERIANAKKELVEMEALLEEPVWKKEDIFSGLQVEGRTERYIIIQQGFGVDSFRIYGALHNMFAPYVFDGRSKKKMAEWLNETQKSRSSGPISTFFKNDI